MEPITVVASKVVSLFIGEFSKEASNALVRSISTKGIQIIKMLSGTIRRKFQTSKLEGILENVEKDPTESNRSMFSMFLEKHMIEDESFFKELTELLEQLQISEGKTVQVMLSNINVTDNLEVGDMKQNSTNAGKSVKQTMATDIKAKNVKLGNLTQEG